VSHTALLRASGEHSGERFELNGVLDGSGLAVGVPHAEPLLRFADAIIDGDAARRADAHTELFRTLGGAVLVDAAAIVASFNAVVKIADATGIPLEDYKAAATQDLREALDLERFRR
jgi:hypothetical protein